MTPHDRVGRLPDSEMSATSGRTARALGDLTGDALALRTERPIRDALRAHLQRSCAYDPTARIVDELSLCTGAARVDLAVVNGSISGYEIKSAADTLNRLPRQRTVYNRALEFVVLVCDETHVAAARRRVPAWWGLWLAHADASGAMADVAMRFTELRRAMPNPKLDVRATAELLWRDEAVALLRAHDRRMPPKSATRARIWDRLVLELTPAELLAGVRTALKERSTWRVGAPPVRSAVT